jgi:hypothetical protein
VQVNYVTTCALGLSEVAVTMENRSKKMPSRFRYGNFEQRVKVGCQEGFTELI